MLSCRYLNIELMVIVHVIYSTWKQIMLFLRPSTNAVSTVDSLYGSTMKTARWRLSSPIFETDLSTVWGIQGSYVITANTHSPSFKELSHTKWDPWVRLFFLSDRVALCIEGAVFPWWRQGATGTYPGSGSALWGDFSGQAGEITLIGCVGYCSPLKLKDFFCGDFI